METTVIIRTLNRPSLTDTLFSCEREQLKAIVVGDGVWPDFVEDYWRKAEDTDSNFCAVEEVFNTGKKYGHYGYMALNMGALAADTEFITVLDDDDEFTVGAGDIIRSKLKERPEIDIWIPGLQFNNGMILCKDKSKGLSGGNVACPTYKTEIFTNHPFTHKLVDLYPDYSDYIHVVDCVNGGYKADWFGEVLINVRPKLEGTNGRGK